MLSDISILVIIWLLITALLTFFSWKRKKENVGSALSFVAFLSVIHLLQALVYTLPEYRVYFDKEIVTTGFAQATIALFSFTFGVLIISPLLKSAYTKFNVKRPNLSSTTHNPIVDRQISFIYIAIGLLSYFIFSTLLSTIPTGQAFGNALIKFLHIGIIIYFAQDHQSRNPIVTIILLALFLIWPVISVVRDGFLGFGLVPTLMVGIFFGLRSQHLGRIIFAAVVSSYLMITILTVYFTSRNDLRSIVWGGNVITSPLEDAYNTFARNFRWFELGNGAQLSWIEDRFPYNYFTGITMQRIDSGLVDAAGGRTIESAVLSVIPRLFWPDKPIVVGGSVLFQYFTGIPIAPGTTVGLSPVLELYANYKSPGVIMGFLILGTIFGRLDAGAANALSRKNYMGFAVWFAPVFGLILVQDDLLTLVGTTVSSWMTVIIINIIIRTYFRAAPSPTLLPSVGQASHELT